MESILLIHIHGHEGEVKYGGRQREIVLGKKPILWAIEKVVSDIRKVREMRVHIQKATFSGTRQVIATVNTLAWGLGVKVNGKRQLKALYSGKPNITVAKP